MDGDECIVGLMAKHLYDGKEVPVFFWGQRYGFSLVEEGAICVGYATGGMNEMSVKLAMLGLWAIGIVFFYLTLTRVSEKESYLPLLVALVYIMSPAWAVGSMKAYLGSFMMGAIVMYIAMSQERAWTWVVAGMLIVLLCLQQPLWMAALQPLVVYSIVKRQTVKKLMALLSGLVICALPFMLMHKTGNAFWSPGVFDYNIGRAAERIALVPQRVADNLKGYYFLSQVYDAPRSALVFTYIFMGVILLLLAAGVYYAITGFKSHRRYMVSVLAMLGVMAYTLLMPEYAPRYLLPLTGTVLLALFLFLDGLGRKTTIMCVGLGAMIAIGAVCMVGFRKYSCNPTTKEPLMAAIGYLEKNNVHEAYCTGSMLQWQVDFYSQEKVVCRFRPAKDRYVPYIKQVDEALAGHKPVALMGYSMEVPEMGRQVDYDAGGYRVYLGVDEGMVRGVGFE